MHVILRPLLRYADFKGRASRAEYWLFGLTQSVIYGLIVLCGVLMVSEARENPSGAIGGFFGCLVLAVILAVALLIPNLALLARRMHDINLSAWWMGLMVPGYLAQWSNVQMAIQAYQASGGGANAQAMQQALATSAATTGILGLIAAGCGLALFVIVLIPGNKGPNRFGNDPKDDSGSGGMARKVPAFDEARIDAAIADLKAETPYKPVFDFGPGSEDKPIMSMREAQPSEAPAPSTKARPSPAARYGVTDARPTFGRRS